MERRGCAPAFGPGQYAAHSKGEFAREPGIAGGLSAGRPLSTRMLRRAYDWCIAAADKPYALWLLGAISFAESSFFPIPPDTMLIPMSLARPKRAFGFAAWCTIASVTGGVLGYAIGALLYDTVGHWLISIYGYGDKVEEFRAAYAKWGAWIILLKGLTPIPYKIVTITSGFAGYNIWLFVVFSLITRGARFYVLAFLLNRYGERFRAVIEERLGLWVTIGAVVLIGGIVVVLYLF
jgi:membrane protein YqaA with SNARE-associated domain